MSLMSQDRRPPTHQDITKTCPAGAGLVSLTIWKSTLSLTTAIGDDLY